VMTASVNTAKRLKQIVHCSFYSALDFAAILVLVIVLVLIIIITVALYSAYF